MRLMRPHSLVNGEWALNPVSAQEQESRKLVMAWISVLGIVGGLLVVIGVTAWLLLGRLIVSKMLDRRANSCPAVERPEDRGFATERFWLPVDEQHRLHAWIIRPVERRESCHLF